jgi:5-methylcytosine-specific restriction endonuclease McrA
MDDLFKVDIFNKPKKKSQPKINREYVWDHPNIYGRMCSICGRRITKISDMEFDHTRARSKGGVTVRPAHRDCNRMKSNKGLAHVQTKMGLRKTVKRKPRKKQSNDFDPLNFNNVIPKMPRFKIDRI